MKNYKKLQPSNKTETIENSFEIDYDLFTTSEIINIMNFYHNIFKYLHHQLSKDALKASYQLYRKTINSIALEKKYNQAFYEKTHISIYHFMKDLH